MNFQELLLAGSSGYNPDGSKEVVKETISPDGSKTVETTKYPSPKDVENGYFETHDIMLRS